MYVALKGGERAIANAHAWLAEERRGNTAIAELGIAQIREQLALSVNRVMAEGSLFDPNLAALAIKQARGDLIEAIFMIRAYRTTLPRFGATRPVETDRMACDRRISATFKDLPGGQVLGPSFDCTHRLLDFKLAAEGNVPDAPAHPADPLPKPRVTGFLNGEGLIEEAGADETDPPDLTREPLDFPTDRALRLQALARGDEGFILSLAYSTQRGYARNHAFVGELRIGTVAFELDIPELGFAIEIGEVTRTECETANQFKGSKTEPPQFTRGYGLVFATPNGRLSPWRSSIARCVGQSSAKRIRALRRRTRSLSCPMPTTSRPPGFWSIFSCPTMSVSSPSWSWSAGCGARPRRDPNNRPEEKRLRRQSSDPFHRSI